MSANPSRSGPDPRGPARALWQSRAPFGAPRISSLDSVAPLAVCLQPATSIAAPKRRPRRADPGDLERREPVQPLLRGDPARRGPERVHVDRHRRTSTPACSTPTTSSILGEACRSAPPRPRCSATGSRPGGNLIAMRPDPQLAGLLGLTDRRHDARRTATCKVDTTTGARARDRRPDDPVPRHRRPLHADAAPTAIATLYSDATTATANPAVTLRSVGTERRPGRRLHLRPRPVGRLHAAGQPGLGGRGARRHRRRSAPTTSSSAPSRATSSPTGSTSNKVAIPQADEQQRLLANLIGQMNLDRKPLPRFWFLPRDEKAAVVMTGDDHGNGGTAGRFDQYEARQPAGLLGRRLGVRPRAPPTSTRTRRSPTRRPPPTRPRASRSALHVRHELRRLDAEPQLESLLRDQLADLRANYPEPRAAGHQPHPLHRLERLGDAAEGRARERHSPRHQLLLLAAGAGSRTARACSPAPACRCASPISTAR